ncbi:hypothetical protein Rhopal_006271-T1 [Rhodotorula paludigena]|uniref:Uncharacterized protein n=1 Tax=Rhodotorula paludigena TaxID=86838 RepID=A0AAV5GTF2_9BASI|nr:hypothetical protein Rhopal_006271-T1 [Rhodotorula paludigena]
MLTQLFWRAKKAPTRLRGPSDGYTDEEGEPTFEGKAGLLDALALLAGKDNEPSATVSTNASALQKKGKGKQVDRPSMWETMHAAKASRWDATIAEWTQVKLERALLQAPRKMPLLARLRKLNRRNIEVKTRAIVLELLNGCIKERTFHLLLTSKSDEAFKGITSSPEVLDLLRAILLCPLAPLSATHAALAPVHNDACNLDVDNLMDCAPDKDGNNGTGAFQLYMRQLVWPTAAAFRKFSRMYTLLNPGDGALFALQGTILEQQLATRTRQPSDMVALVHAGEVLTRTPGKRALHDDTGWSLLSCLNNILDMRRKDRKSIRYEAFELPHLRVLNVVAADLDDRAMGNRKLILVMLVLPRAAAAWRTSHPR